MENDMEDEKSEYGPQNPMTDAEKITALEETIKQYQDLLEETVADEKKIKTVEAGPFEFDGKNFYRVDGEIKMLSEDSIWGIAQAPILEKGTSVVVCKGAIVTVTPEELEIPEELPSFTLIDWTSIGGLDSQIEEIRQAVEVPINNAALAKTLGVGDFKGLLLYGPAGTGKTIIAKAIASQVIKASGGNHEAFQYVKGAELLSKWVGETEQRIAHMFKVAREYTKKTGTRGVIFMDEAEALLGPRGSRTSSDVDKTIVPTFLSEMDGFDEHSPIMILSTNLPKQIDSAILREGRIDLKIEIKRPEHADAIDIFKIHLKTAKLVDKCEDLAKAGADLIFKSTFAKLKVSGAMIEGIVKGSARKVLSRVVKNPKDKQQGITLTDLTESFKLIETSYAG